MAGVLTSFTFDYFQKDHLGNVRAVVTDEVQQDMYPAATLEPGLVGTERGFYNIDTTKIVPNVMANDLRDTYGNTQTYPNNNTFIANNNPGCGTGALCTTANSGHVYQLNSNSNKTGLGIVLKVMAGDKLNIAGKSYYNQNTTGTGGNSPLPFLDILAGFLGSASGTGGMHSGITPAQINPGTSNTTVNNFLSDQNTQSSSNQTRPKAFVNVLFFDEQFKLAGYKLSMVGNNKELKSHLAELQNIAVPKNGYVYIYCSNESPVPVYFDNIQVVHDRGALLEETNYYPFGLVMSGISSKAAGELENSKKFNGIEHTTDFDLNTYDAFYRNLDPQTGRFWQIDPKSIDEVSPYSALLNNPILMKDPLGDTTVYYDASGNFLYRSSDGNKNVVTFVSDNNLKAFNWVRNTLDNLGVDMNGNFVNGLMRLFGESYDIQGIFNFVDENSKNNPNTQTDIWKPTDGKGPLINEQSAAMENQGGIWTPNPGKIDTSPGSPFSVSIQGSGVTMHTHENEGRTFTQKWEGVTKNAKVPSGKESLAADGDINGAQNKPGTGLLQMAVGKKSIYFYNTSGIVQTVDRDIFNPKYFKKR
jgi:RHS repeat-associated protein